MAESAMTISVISGTTEVPISSIGRLISHDGWGMPPMKRYSESGPLQQGTTDRGYKLDERIGKFVFNLGEVSLVEMYKRREIILSYFAPNVNLKVKFSLYINTGMAEMTKVKVIDCKYKGDLSLPWDAGMWAAQNFAVTLVCNDPTYYDPAPLQLGMGGGGGTGFAVPVVVPMLFGSSTLSGISAINNRGDADEYPIIRLVGPIEDPKVTNLTYGEKLDFNGTHIAAGVTYQMDLRYGYKTVTEIPNTNRIDKLSDDSSLSTWRFRPGINDIQVMGTGITSATQAIFDYYYRYLGV